MRIARQSVSRFLLAVAVVGLSVTSVVAADWPWIYGPRRDHTSDQKGLLRTWPQEGPKVLWTVPVGAGFGGPAVSDGKVYLLDRDEKVGRHAPRARPGERQGALDLRLRRARQLHVRRLADDADGRRRARLHRRADGRSVRHQHEDAEARLAQEHLEGLRRRRRAAAVGDRAESADLRRPADRGAADVRGRRRRLRQADRRAEMEVGRAVRHCRVRDARRSSRSPERTIWS